MRISRALALAGIASRRKSEEHVLNGAVKVNGEVIKELGYQVDPEKDTILFRGRALCFNEFVYFMLHKPKGFVTTVRDVKADKTVYDLLPPYLIRQSRQPKSSRTRVFSVGRLDKDSTGLLLFTNDGEFANRLTHPKYKVDKWYEVRLDRPFNMEDKQKLTKGIYLSEGKAKASKLFMDPKSKRVLRIMLMEGRNREVRRILAKLDYKVQRLCRVSVGPLKLGRLPLGAGRELSDLELKRLKKMVKM